MYLGFAGLALLQPRSSKPPKCISISSHFLPSPQFFGGLFLHGCERPKTLNSADSLSSDLHIIDINAEGVAVSISKPPRMDPLAVFRTSLSLSSLSAITLKQGDYLRVHFTSNEPQRPNRHCKKATFCLSPLPFLVTPICDCSRRPITRGPVVACR